jgi:hypothetical protein
MKVTLDFIRDAIRSTGFYWWELSEGTTVLCDYTVEGANEAESIARLESCVSGIASGVATVKIFKASPSGQAGRPPTKHTKIFMLEIRPGMVQQQTPGIAGTGWSKTHAELLAEIERLKYQSQLADLRREFIDQLNAKEQKKDVWDRLEPVITGLALKYAGLPQTPAAAPAHVLNGPGNVDIMALPMTEDSLQTLINIWAQNDPGYFEALKGVVNLCVNDRSKYDLAKGALK